MLRMRLQATMWGLLLFGLLVLPEQAPAFSYVAEGDSLPNMTLLRLGGGRASYLGDGNQQASVFAFVKGGEPRSEEFLAFLPDLVAEFSDRPVHWSLVVSEAEGEAAAAAFAEKHPAISVLIDPQDALYGALGLALTPAVGVADAQFRLDAYLPYRKINYQAIIRAQISYLLGDIDQEGLQAVLEPVPTTLDSTMGRARRGLKLARILLSRGKIAQARSHVDSALAVCPDLAEAYELLAEIHNVEGDLAGAEAAAKRARFLAGSEHSG